MVTFEVVGSCVVFIVTGIVWLVTRIVGGDWVEFWLAWSSLAFLFACFYDRYPRGRALDAYQSPLDPRPEYHIGRIAFCGIPLLLYPVAVTAVVLFYLYSTDFNRADYVLPLYLGHFGAALLLTRATNKVRARPQ